MDKVVHFEIPADDMNRAKAFYEKTFGWEINLIPSFGYAIIHTVKVDEKQMPKERGAINGGIMQRKQIKNPVVTINVADIGKACKSVEKNGGKIILEKFKVGDMGYSAYFQDCEGNALGLWQEIKSNK